MIKNVQISDDILVKYRFLPNNTINSLSKSLFKATRGNSKELYKEHINES